MRPHLFMLAVAGLHLLAVPGPASADAKIIIQSATVLPMDGSRRTLENHTVIVDGRHIAWVGPSSEAPQPKDATVIKAAGKFLIPGLTDCHVHLFDRSQLALYLANGVTTVFNMSGTPRILQWRDEIAAGTLIGPRIYTTGPQIKDERVPFYDGVLTIESISHTEAIVQMHKKMGYRFLKIWSSLRPDYYDAIVREARKAGLRVTGHVPSRVNLKGALASGQESVAHLEELVNKFFVRNLDGEGIANAAQILREYDAPVITTLITYEMITDTADDERLAARLARPENRFIDPILFELWKPERNEWLGTRARRDYFENAFAFEKRLAGELHQRGVKLLAGTDAGLFTPNLIPGWSLHRELELLVESGLTPMDALQSATAFPGEYFTPGTQAGRIRAGAPADLVLLDENPAESIEHTRSICAVIANGVCYSRAALDEMLDDVLASHAGSDAFRRRILDTNAKDMAAKMIRALDDGQEIEFPSETAMLTAAYLYAAQGKMEDADAITRLTRKAFPESYVPAYFHAGLFEMMERKSERREALKAALRLAPHHEQVRLMLEWEK